jgi:hypothetical protein
MTIAPLVAASTAQPAPADPESLVYGSCVLSCTEEIPPGVEHQPLRPVLKAQSSAQQVGRVCNILGRVVLQEV